MIAILSCLGLDTEVLDDSMKTTGSNEYREMLKSDRVTNEKAGKISSIGWYHQL